MKIVINACHGGFGLSDEAVVRYHEIKGLPLWVTKDKEYDSISHYWTVPESERIEESGDKFYKMTMDERQSYNEKWREQTFSVYDIERTDPVLVQVVNELGDLVNSRYSELKIVDIPDDVNWEIAEYDGVEWVAEVHRTWR